jgi:outer membrane protein OmpA-like peptidoglycan-associated protein
MAEQTASDQGALRFFTDAWPLLALGIVAATIIRACVPFPMSSSGADTTGRPDASGTEKSANSGALTALGALTPEAGIEQVVGALNLLSIDFAAGSSTLPDSGEPVLTKAAAVIAARPAAERFDVSAHADGALSPLADLEVSRRRSQAIVDFLVDQGVPTQRLQARAIGDQDPVASEPGQESGARNQRIQFTLLP